VAVDTWSAFIDPLRFLPARFVELCGKSIHLGETLFAALVFPERRQAVLDELARRRPTLERYQLDDPEQLLDQLEVHTDQAIAEIDLDSVFLIGLSVTFSQVFSSAYYARQLRRRRPQARVVLGGALCPGPIGKMLLRQFDCIDYIVRGEGERPLTELIEHLLRGEAVPEIGGLATRGVLHDMDRTDKNQLADLDGLPLPDYDEYFAKIRELPGQEYFQHEIRLPLETSRGCWWDRSHKKTDALCQFCDNNKIWAGFRTKSPDRVVSDISAQMARYQVPRVLFTDNVTRVKGLQTLYAGIAGLSKGLTIFTEAYANLGIEDFSQMRGGGVREVQIGIEALNTRILDLMHKGTTLLQNAFAMKMLDEFDLKSYSNLITHYPQVSRQDIAASRDNVIRLCAYHPLHPTEFEVNLDSPIARSPERYGLANVRLHPVFQRLLSAEVQSELLIPPSAFDAPEVRALDADWDRLIETVRWWKSNRERKRSIHQVDRLLFHVSWAGFVEVHDLRFERPRSHRLTGWEADLYQFLYFPRTTAECTRAFPTVAASEIAARLDRWYRGDWLLVRDDDGWLALSISECRPDPARVAVLAQDAPPRFRRLGAPDRPRPLLQVLDAR
jgi:ribosomal peptide maturation radical SAM protein 1